MKKLITLAAVMLMSVAATYAQDYNQITDDGTFTAQGYQQDRNFGRSDSVQSNHKEIPRGLKVWTIDDKFGDRTPAVPDTVPDMYMNTIFTTGLHGEYNTLGNVGSPRQNRIFVDRERDSQFPFLDVYDYFIVKPSQFHFTNTLSPITNVSLNSAGNRTNGEDHFKALFAVNAGKRLGFGFKFDYIYGRGYYSNQSTSHFNYTMWGSYLGDRYQAHLLFSTNHEKVAENGGITNDAYVTHPEMFNDNYSADELPTVLERNWNRNDNQHVFFNHRYSIGFFKKVPMTAEEIEAKKFAMKSQKEEQARNAKEKARKQAEESGEDFDETEYDREQRSTGRPENSRIAGDEPVVKEAEGAAAGRVQTNRADSVPAIVASKDTADQWMKREYVPVTSFIHTLDFNHYRRIYEAYESPENYYANDFYTPLTFTGDSIFDVTRHWSLRNTFALALLEGFNKWAKAGLKVFASYELRHFELPSADALTDKWNQHNLSVGGQLLKTQGTTVHYDVSAETWLAGSDAGQLKIDGNGELNFPLLGDTVQLRAHAHFYRLVPTFYQTNYHSRHFWWDNQDLSDELRTRLSGTFSLKKAGVRMRVAYDNIKNYTYIGMAYNIDGTTYNRTDYQATVRQHTGAISLLTLQLRKNFEFWHLLNWQTELTYQKSSEKEVLPVPDLNVYTNLFLRFHIAKVLRCDLGADLRYFTRYYAPEYNPQLGQFGIQETQASRVKTGNYPLVNVYANFFLKHTRFFVMLSHVNYSSSGGEYFLTPHYPLNQRIFRFGVSWNFFN